MPPKSQSRVPAWFLIGLFSLVMALGLTGCVEEKVTEGSYFGTDSGFKPSRTKFERPPEPEEPGIDWLYPFELIGDGFSYLGHSIASLWEPSGNSGGSSDSDSFTMSTPDGRNVTVPKNYSGTQDYRGKDGQDYKLRFDNGRMTGIERANGSK